MAPDSSQSELPSSDVNDVAENRDIIMTAPDGTEWHHITFGDYYTRRLSQQNILREAFRPTPYASSKFFAGSPVSAGLLLIDSSILKLITKRTINEATANHKIRRLLLLWKNRKRL